MPTQEPAFTVGIEEEYLLVDRETRDLVQDPPEAMLRECAELLDGRATPEFLRSQLEVGTRVASSIADLREDLSGLRRVVGQVADSHGIAFIAASTHPFASWPDQLHTDHDRYNMLAEDLQAVVRRLLICGMHVHVGIAEDNVRIDLMNQVTYFLPHLLALSGSSPYWSGIDSGLKSYRTTVFRSMPRTGLPTYFTSWAEYRRHVQALVETGVIEDATKVWWDLRPSDRYPTLEMRSTDICTRLDDSITVAALYVSLLRMLWSRRRMNQKWRIYAHMLIQENVWRAQRYGTSGSLIDFGKGELVPFAELVDEIIELVAEDAEALGCLEEVQNARNIVNRGTSADRQRMAYQAAVAGGASDAEALQAVVDFLIAETLLGT
ncbi:MAG: carboxylate-amine ligase [Acidimicrobiia bacterium]|nr:carboxylate-amine ligase [Acidimicrobiia bacterium]